jgi:hypothetical protein
LTSNSFLKDLLFSVAVVFRILHGGKTDAAFSRSFISISLYPFEITFFIASTPLGYEILQNFSRRSLPMYAARATCFVVGLVSG